MLPPRRNVKQERGGGQTQRGKSNRFTTRNLAALEFLRNINMQNESDIVENGLTVAKRAQGLYDTDAYDMDGSDDEELEELQRRHMALKQQIAGADPNTGDDSAAVGRKLQGRPALTVRVPLQFRHHMIRLTEGSAVVRQWEDQLLKYVQPAPVIANRSNKDILAPPKSAAAMYEGPSFLRSRIFCSRSRAYPMAVFSIMAYDAGKERAKKDRLKAEDTQGDEAFQLPKRDWRGLSYKPLFKALADDYVYEPGYIHEPDDLDDSALLHGEHRHMLQRSAITGPVLSSVILYVNDQALKEHLNEQFRESHPALPPSLTLSKIRSLKKQVLIGCLAMDLEVSTVALAVISFERLILKGLITKLNRRLAMSTCLLLAYKFNELQLHDVEVGTVGVISPSMHKASQLDAIFMFVDQKWSISRRQLFDAEFGTFVHLGFTLHVPAPQLFTVFTRLLKLVNRTPRGYIDSEIMETHTNDIFTVERAKQTVRLQRREKEEEEEALAEAEAEAARKEEEETLRSAEEIEAEAQIEEDLELAVEDATLNAALATEAKQSEGDVEMGSVSKSAHGEEDNDNRHDEGNDKQGGTKETSGKDKDVPSRSASSLTSHNIHKLGKRATSKKYKDKDKDTQTKRVEEKEK